MLGIEPVIPKQALPSRRRMFWIWTVGFLVAFGALPFSVPPVTFDRTFGAIGPMPWPWVLYVIAAFMMAVAFGSAFSWGIAFRLGLIAADDANRAKARMLMSIGWLLLGFTAWIVWTAIAGV